MMIENPTARLIVWFAWVPLAMLVVGYAVYHLFGFDDHPHGLVSRLTELLFGPISVLMVGASIRVDNSRLRSLTSIFSAVSIVMSIGFLWVAIPNVEDTIRQFSATPWTQVFALFVNFSYLVIYFWHGVKHGDRVMARIESAKGNGSG